MKSSCLRGLSAAVVAWATLGTAHGAPGCPALPSRASPPAEALPQPVNLDDWRQRQAQIKQQVAGTDLSGTRLVFIGDSITQGWDPVLWQLFWGDKHALNLGVRSDLTQGALWRLNNGNWNATLHPKLVVLLIGTNNANWKSRPEDTALGVAEIIRFVHSRSPSTKVLLLGLLPRGADASTPERAVNDEVNALIQRCADGRDVVYLDPGAAMKSADGHVTKDVFFDFLHPTMVGYAILGGAIEAQIRKMMQ